VGGANLSGDVSALSKIGGGPAALDITGISSSAHERIGGLRTGEMAFTSFWNDAAGQMYPTLSALPTADVQMTYFRGATIGNAAASMVAKQLNFNPTRAADGLLTAAVDAQSNAYGLEWGNQLTAGVRTDTAATNGASWDAGASSAFGLQAYLHVFAVTGTSMTVKLQESSDDGGGDAFADVVGGAFTVVAAGATSGQRIATATNLTVERYLRVVTTGTFNPGLFAVMVVRNSAAPVF
jgi:hypothetical protein